MRSTLSGITAKKELGIDSDQQDIDLKKAERDTTALEGVGSKDERMKRLNAMRSKNAVGRGAARIYEAHGRHGGRSSSPDVHKLAKKRANSPMDELMSRHATQEDGGTLRVPGQGALGFGLSEEGREEGPSSGGSKSYVSACPSAHRNFGVQACADGHERFSPCQRARSRTERAYWSFGFGGSVTKPLRHNPADRFDEEHGAEGRHRALVFHGGVVLLVRPVLFHERVHRQEDLDRPGFQDAHRAERLGHQVLPPVSDRRS